MSETKKPVSNPPSSQADIVTVPPPAVGGDAYSAPTVVRDAPDEILDLIRAQQAKAASTESVASAESVATSAESAPVVRSAPPRPAPPRPAAGAPPRPAPHSAPTPVATPAIDGAITAHDEAKATAITTPPEALPEIEPTPAPPARAPAPPPKPPPGIDEEARALAAKIMARLATEETERKERASASSIVVSDDAPNVPPTVIVADASASSELAARADETTGSIAPRASGAPARRRPLLVPIAIIACVLAAMAYALGWWRP